MKILVIHGIGGQDATIESWSKVWESNIKNHIGNRVETSFTFMKFDTYFTTYDVRFFDYVKLFTSYFIKQLKDRKAQKGFKDVMDNYPDMVAEFLLKNDLRERLRE